MKELRALVPLAPLHLPLAISAIERVAEQLPRANQVACFDTAFHSSMPAIASRVPLPKRFAGVRRFGFHGLSYEYIMSTLAPRAPSRIVIAHLGSGSSLVAVRDGHSVDTTMGFTPLGGILMGTRSGDLDPGVLVYLARQTGMNADQLEEVFTRECGWIALAGTADMRQILARAPEDAGARLALEMFGYAIKKAIGAFAAALGGLDLLVFTGRIGEGSARVRELACDGLAPLGIAMDPARNATHGPMISAGSSQVLIRVVPTDEELMIARQSYRVQRGGAAVLSAALAAT
jgi:acetate kinase